MGKKSGPTAGEKSIPNRRDVHVQKNVKSIAICRHWTSQDKDQDKVQDKDKDQDKVQDKAENFSRRCFVGSEVNRLKRCSTQPEKLL